MSSEKFTIPNNNSDLDVDLKNRKPEYMKHILKLFCDNIKDDSISEKIYFFKFSDTNLEIVIKKKNYISNLKNLLDYYVKIEEYENCNIINNLIKGEYSLKYNTNEIIIFTIDNKKSYQFIWNGNIWIII